MILLATLIALGLMVWALVLATQAGTPRGRLCAMAGGLFLGTVAAWLAVVLGVSGSMWAMAREQGAVRDDLVVAGLGAAALAGVGLLVVCVPVLVVLIVDTRALLRRIDAQHPPVHL